MKEETKSPIEELIEELLTASRQQSSQHASLALLMAKRMAENKIKADKAHREQYKHTKEDVIKAYIKGDEDSDITELDYTVTVKNAEQYYEQLNINT